MKETPNELIIKPFRKGMKGYLQVVLVAIVVYAIFVYFNDNIEWFWIATSLLGLGIVYTLYFWAVLCQIQVVFDKQNKVIYRKYGSLFSVRLLSFSEATLLFTEHNYSGMYYSLAHKENRYKSLQKISYYLSEEEAEQYEYEVITKVRKLLD